MFGGSQGAQAINRAIVAALPLLDEWRGKLEIIHQSGEKGYQETLQGYRDSDWQDAEVTPFIKDMANAYARATLIVCRAGATTLAELTACGRPAILVPYPHAAAGHQSTNARALAAKGAAMTLEEADLTPERLATLINGLLHDRTSIKTMASAAKGLARRGASARLLQECRAVLKEAF